MCGGVEVNWYNTSEIVILDAIQTRLQKPYYQESQT